MACSVTASQPLPRWEPGLPGATVRTRLRSRTPCCRPGREVAVLRLREAEVVAVLLEDVAQAAGERPHVGGDAEAQADRMAGRRVRVLADDQDADVVQRLLEGREDAGRAGGRNGRLAARSALQEVAQLGDHVGYGRERVGPAGADAVGQRARLRLRGAHAVRS